MTSSDAYSGPLAGVRVLDVTRALSGPFAAMMLADIGADVVKVEMPGRGDEARHWGPPFLGDSGGTFVGFNRNKRSVAIDLHKPEGQETFRKLAASSDVVIENFRPGTMARFGVGFDVLRGIRPDLIYCAISGYGQTGPLADQPAMDLMIQAMGGLMAGTGEPNGDPYKAAAPVADIMGGFAAAFSVLAAIRQRDKDGKGRAIDISMLDSLISLMGQAVTAYGMTGKPPQRVGNDHPFMAPYTSFKTATKGIVISLTTEARWQALGKLPETRHLLEDQRYTSQIDRNAHRDVLCGALQEIFLTAPAEHWLEALQPLGVPIAPINELQEILHHPHVVQRPTLMEIEYPPHSGNFVLIPGMPWRDVASRRPISGPPTIGQHTAEVLEDGNRGSENRRAPRNRTHGGL